MLARPTFQNYNNTQLKPMFYKLLQTHSYFKKKFDTNRQSLSQLMITGSE
jgi:hypothetical protein